MELVLIIIYMTRNLLLQCSILNSILFEHWKSSLFSLRISPATCYIISKYFPRSFPSLNTYTSWSMCSSIVIKKKPLIKPKPYEHKLSLSPRILKICISYVMVAMCLFVSAHINHIRAVAGVNHVGLGAGYDGINL